jgi:iron complex transport system substrate-binding protein
MSLEPDSSISRSSIRLVGSPRSARRWVRDRRPRVTVVVLAVVGVAALCLGASASGAVSARTAGLSAQAGKTQVIVDAAGRHVTVPIPADIHRIVMIGAPPDIDGFVIAIGDGSLIVNGIPAPFSAAHFGWKILEPRLVKAPNVEANIGSPVDPEEMLALKPDIVFTPIPSLASQVQKLGIPTVVLTQEVSGNMNQERDAMTLLGKILGKPQAAAKYVKYFDSMVTLVGSRIKGIPASQRPSALYLATRPLRRNGPAMVWYMNFLGVKDVAGNVPPITQFTPEQILQWNPDYIIAHDPSDVPYIKTNSVLKNLSAVKDGHMESIPQDLNEWGDFDVAAPLALLWTAKFVYPNEFKDINMTAEAKTFYKTFYGENLSTADLNEILYGIGGSKVNFGA